MLRAQPHPQKPDLGRRLVPFSKELWIERDDFMETRRRVISGFSGNVWAAVMALS